MSVSIRELKRNYKVALAMGQVLPTQDRAIPLPLSTGDPLFDAALVGKVKATATLNEPEHLGRAWHLVRTADEGRIATLVAHRRRLLNDYKQLLAIDRWRVGDEERCRELLGALPWRWRLGFATAVIKPAAAMFTGWRRNISFRLVEDPRYPALRELFRETLASAPPIALLKYRATVKEAAALLKFRFEGDRERAIHALAFDKGRGLETLTDLEPIGTYVRARQALRGGGVFAFLDVLTTAEQVIPITSYMGMLGSEGIRLTDASEHEDALRDYAVRCATAVECLLRLVEWGPWMSEQHAERLSRNVRHQIIERGLDVPFFKVVKAFMNAPTEVRKLVLEPLFLPLLRHFGKQVAGRLGDAQMLHFVQPANVIHVMSFLLYTVVSSAMPSRLVLLRRKGTTTIDGLDVEDVARRLADHPTEFQDWLLGELGGLTTRYDFTYDYPALAKVVKNLDPAAPMVLDLPFSRSMELLESLLPFEQVFNLNDAYGAPGELCIAYEYYETFLLRSGGKSVGIYGRYTDAAAQRFAETMDQLGHFRALTAGAGGTP